MLAELTFQFSLVVYRTRLRIVIDASGAALDTKYKSLDIQQQQSNAFTRQVECETHKLTAVFKSKPSLCIKEHKVTRFQH